MLLATGAAAAAGAGTPVDLLSLGDDAGQVRDVREPEALAAPSSVSIGALGNGALEPADDQDVAGTGVRGARLAVRTPAAEVFIGTRDSGSDVCIAARAKHQGAALSTCQSAAGVARGALWVGDASGLLAGIAPDGVSKVLVTDASGASQIATVTNNAYVVTTDRQVARIAWRSADGDRADLALPVTKEFFDRPR